MMKVSVVILIVLTLLGTGLAQARPRDEVMSKAYRCGTIGDNRDWLDCYYGAAQPVRAVLGLPPVPTRQQSLADAPQAGTVLPADLHSRDQVMAEASRCYAVDEDRQWLNCYYASAAAMRALLNLPAPAGTTAPGPDPSVIAKKANGTVLAHMTGYSFDQHRWFTVELDNGQVWRQISGDTDYAAWKEPAGRYRVAISPGFAGSFNLRVLGHAGLYKVARIR